MDLDDEYISLNSSEDYGDDGSSYFVDAVLAEKQTSDGETLWLVSWDGYDSDYHMWLPEENFDDPHTLREWEIKKKKIIDGVVRPYDWQRWERNQENLKQQKAVRQEKRERKRAQSKATKKKGQWITPRKYRRGREGKRSRSQSDDTYSEDEEPIERPPKRQVIIDSDSDDDIPLASLIRTKAVSGITSSIPTGLVGAFSLPIRSSQSPFPRETAKVGLQKSVENIGLANTLITSSSSQRNGKLAAPGTLQSTGKTAASKAANEAAIPGPKLIIETKDISTQNPVPQVRATAIRSSIPKSQNVFNIPKRVNMAKGKAPPRAGNLESPTVKDFYSHIARHWKHAPRDRDNRRPDTSNMTLMSISAAAESTSVPAYKRGSISIPETDLTLIESGMNVPSARSDKIDLGTSMFNRGTSAGNPAGYVVEKSNFSRETALDQPFIEGSPHEEDSLFVTDGQDVTMRDVGVGASLPISDPADAELTRSSGRQIDKPKRWSNPTPVNHSAAMSSTQASNKPVLTARASIDQLPNSTNVTVSSRNAKETGAKGSAQAISSRIDLNRVRAVLVGNLESLDLEAGNRGYERLCDPTYIQLALPHTQLLCVQIKNFKTVEHHQLLQHDAPQNLRRVFHLREKYATFEDFLSKQEHKGECMYFSAGLIEARAGEIESARLLSRIENAIVCSGYHVSLLIWSVNHPSWSSVSKRFLRAIPSGSFGVIMFKTALHSNISPNSRGYSTSRARSPTRNTSKQSMPDFFDRDLQTVNHDFAGTSPLVRKRSTTKKVHESEEEFSRDMMTQQKKPLLQESAKTSSPANITKPSEMVTNSEKAITKTSRDPRAPSRDRVSPATGLTHVTPTIPSISLFSFVDFCKYFMARVPHTKESAMKIFKEKLNIDWRNMVRYDKPIIYAFVQYPPKVVSRELSVLKEFLHAIRAHEYYANVHSHWAALQPLIKSRPWHHGKENRAIVKDKFDPDKHVRVHTGNDAVILIHDSMSMLELPMQQLVKSLTNPHLRIFKITLGEPYEDRNAITVKPVPTVKELVRGGEYVLLTDSVIIKRPLEALDMLKWLMIKLKRGGHQLWKIYGRPKLSSWLVDLAASYDANSEVSKTYREMYLYLDMLVPEDDRKNYYDDDWVPTFTSVFQNPVVLPGYRYGIGTDTERADVRADLVNNDRMLIKWFGSVTQPLVEDIRFFTAVSEIHDQLHENLTDEWKHIRIYPTDWFVTAYVKSTILRNQWKQEDEEIEGKS